jgi:hypothetical protein
MRSDVFSRERQTHHSFHCEKCIQEARSLKYSRSKSYKLPSRVSLRGASSIATLQFSCTASRHSSRSHSLGVQIQEAHSLKAVQAGSCALKPRKGKRLPTHSVESGFIQTEDIRSKGG